jgi:hypothetical protein
MEKIIEKYIDYMKDKHNIIGAMITGSYVTKMMKPHSDIDIFFLGSDLEKSIRGREYFMGVEFEYFISPEWKYYDRIKTDLTAIRIYSKGVILLDSEGKFEEISKRATLKIDSYNGVIEEVHRPDYKFYVETIFHDGIDMFDSGEFSDFVFFTSTSLDNLCKIVCKMRNRLPIYIKNGVSEMKTVDIAFGNLVESFIRVDYNSQEKKDLWEQICNYVQNLLGDVDISTFESVQSIKEN